MKRGLALLLCTGLAAFACLASSAHAQPDPYRTRTFVGLSAAIIEARVDDLKYTYDVHTGPRTVIDLSVTNVIAGKLATDHLSIPFFGGPLPDGRFMSMSLSVDFAVGRRFVLCLINQDWFYTPFVGDPLRVRTVRGREILVNRGGHAAIGLSPRGLLFSPVRLYSGEDPSDAAGADQMEIADAPAAAVAGALDRKDLIRLLDEGMAIEKVAPSGVFPAGPLARERWQIEKTEPVPGAPPPSAGEATDAVIPETPATGTVSE